MICVTLSGLPTVARLDGYIDLLMLVSGAVMSPHPGICQGGEYELLCRLTLLVLQLNRLPITPDLHCMRLSFFPLHDSVFN